MGGSVVDGLMLEHRSPGVVEFHIDGVEYTLVVFTDSEPPARAQRFYRARVTAP